MASLYSVYGRVAIERKREKLSRRRIRRIWSKRRARVASVLTRRRRPRREEEEEEEEEEQREVFLLRGVRRFGSASSTVLVDKIRRRSLL